MRHGCVCHRHRLKRPKLLLKVDSCDCDDYWEAGSRSPPATPFRLIVIYVLITCDIMTPLVSQLSPEELLPGLAFGLR